MKKTPRTFVTPRKLVLRAQTLRVLADDDLRGAVGGLDSGNAMVPPSTPAVEPNRCAARRGHGVASFARHSVPAFGW